MRSYKKQQSPKVSVFCYFRINVVIVSQYFDLRKPCSLITVLVKKTAIISKHFSEQILQWHVIEIVKQRISPFITLLILLN